VVEEGVGVGASEDKPLSDDERLRLIVQAFLHCHQIPEVRLVAHQFWTETKRVVSADQIERAIRRAAVDC
jgi:hypothetical protein